MDFPFKTLLIFDVHEKEPLYVQISRKLIELISQGRILPGTYLPGTREMASILGVHRKTIIRAYDEATILGWIEPVMRRGFRVLKDLPLVKPKSFKPKNNFVVPEPVSDELSLYYQPDVADSDEIYSNNAVIIDDGCPDIRIAPIERLLRQQRYLLGSKTVKNITWEGNAGGRGHLRDSSCVFLNQNRGLNISRDNLMITRGAQMAIYLAAVLLLKPGDKVVVSDPNYYLADEVFQQLGAVICRVPMDNEGIDIDKLQEVLRKDKIRLLYVIPQHHYPTTFTMSVKRRQELLDCIKQYNLWVLEDDYSYDLNYFNNPLLPLASSDHNGKIVYIGSYTKILGPSLRTGYIVANKQFIEQAVALRRLIDFQGDFLMEEALGELIDNGGLKSFINKSKVVYSARLTAASYLLKEELNAVASFVVPQGGMAIWLHFDERYPLVKVIKKAREQQLHWKGSTYYKDSNVRLNSLRFGFASLNESELETAIGKLKNALKKC